MEFDALVKIAEKMLDGKALTKAEYELMKKLVKEDKDIRAEGELESYMNKRGFDNG